MGSGVYAEGASERPWREPRLTHGKGFFDGPNGQACFLTMGLYPAATSLARKPSTSF